MAFSHSGIVSLLIYDYKLAKKQYQNDKKPPTFKIINYYYTPLAIAKHVIVNKHQCKFDDMKFLVNVRNKTELQIHEVRSSNSNNISYLLTVFETPEKNCVNIISTLL